MAVAAASAAAASVAAQVRRLSPLTGSRPLRVLLRPHTPPFILNNVYMASRKSTMVWLS